MVKPKPTMEDASNAFYVVRKVGIYKSLSDCQAQVSSLVCDPSVSVYKGYSLPKETEQYVASRGLKTPLYSMHSDDVKEDLFGTLVPCPFQQPDGLAFLVDKSSKKAAAQKKSKQAMNNLEAVESSSFLAGQLNKFPRLEDHIMAQVLRTIDGNILSRVREGLGIATNNVAEYRALILGINMVLRKVFSKFRWKVTQELSACRYKSFGKPNIQTWLTCVKRPNDSRICFCRSRLAMS
ncbi:uncharacterized protein M6B38_404080 [Iris pallida]|uniref:Uncharacterized protein n=1 Tax=Iris pallida TaxID=29817 RepID=A0AAX6FRZ3_IRIPA|nr:uncharacterized protein M6B38_404080 [Iris pallida]